MVPQLTARVDGLPVSLLERQVVWPAPDGGRGRSALSPRRRTRIERQAAGVHPCRLPGWARALAKQQQTDAERVEIRAELGAGGCCRCAAITASSGGRRRS